MLSELNKRENNNSKHKANETDEKRIWNKKNNLNINSQSIWIDVGMQCIDMCLTLWYSSTFKVQIIGIWLTNEMPWGGQ